MAETFTLVTDGACSGNGTDAARGGWAAIVTAPDGSETVLTGGEFPTTNNRMELTAALAGPQAQARRIVVEQAAGEVVMRTLGSPLRLSVTPVRTRRLAAGVAERLAPGRVEDRATLLGVS